MDVQMPEMDGLEATRQIRLSEQGTGRHIPILATTADAGTEDREPSLNAGMDDHISKPISRKDWKRRSPATPRCRLGCGAVEAATNLFASCSPMRYTFLA